jgi:hypothetical protein
VASRFLFAKAIAHQPPAVMNAGVDREDDRDRAIFFALTAMLRARGDIDDYFLTFVVDVALECVNRGHTTYPELTVDTNSFSISWPWLLLDVTIDVDEDTTLVADVFSQQHDNAIGSIATIPVSTQNSSLLVAHIVEAYERQVRHKQLGDFHIVDEAAKRELRAHCILKS